MCLCVRLCRYCLCKHFCKGMAEDQRPCRALGAGNGVWEAQQSATLGASVVKQNQVR